MSALNLPQTAVVLIVDDALDNLAYLHDALDESGYTVLVADGGKAALERARLAAPDIILLDAMMPQLDGFETCRQLKLDNTTQHIPVIFMTGLTEEKHVAEGFDAGGIDYVTKPIRPREVLARIASHLQTVKRMDQARGALDAFGQAVISIMPSNGKIVWQSPLARQWMQSYFYQSSGGEPSLKEITPAPLHNWIEQIYKTTAKGMNAQPLSIMKETSRLTFTLVAQSDDEEWIIVLREESDTVHIATLIAAFKLTNREAEVLYWTIKGKTNRDIGDILGSSPRTVNKHLEHVFVKLGVETRTAAASLAASKLRL